MKHATLGIALSLLASTTALAQTAPPPVNAAESPPTATGVSSEPETLTTGGAAGGTRISGWFIAPTFGTTTFDDRVHYLPGLRAGFYLNKRFAVGVAASGVVGSEKTMTTFEPSGATAVCSSSTSGVQTS